MELAPGNEIQQIHTEGEGGWRERERIGEGKREGGGEGGGETVKGVFLTLSEAYRGFKRQSKLFVFSSGQGHTQRNGPALLHLLESPNNNYGKKYPIKSQNKD